MYKLVGPICIVFTLAACATATPFATNGGTQQNALIEGDAGVMASIPTPGSYAFLEAINGKQVNGSDSKALVPSGKYTFNVDCEFHNGSELIQGNQNITFAAEAGHIYKFSVNPSEQSVSGHSFLTKIFGNEIDTCKPFAYDATAGSGPYPETVHIVPPYEPSNWKGSGKAYGGHSVQDWILEGEDKDNWSQMVEIEYWSKLMFPESADQLLHARIATAEKQCPGTQLTVMSETNNDVYFELDDANCAASKIRAQLSRFMVSQYGVYEVSYLSTQTITDADRTAWLKTLHNANTMTRH